jgi:hypothetical protein
MAWNLTFKTGWIWMLGRDWLLVPAWSDGFNRAEIFGRILKQQAVRSDSAVREEPFDGVCSALHDLRDAFGE